MSRYLVTSGSNYNPLSYAEIAAPLESMATAQNEAADAYDALGMQTQALSNYITDNDPEVKAAYDNYMNTLTQLQNNLWDNGVNAGTRRQLAAARAGYAKDIAAIDSAIKRRQDASKLYREARLKDPSLVQGADPSRDSLDLYFHNDTYGTDWYSYSGDQFMKEVQADAKNRVNEIIGKDSYYSGRDPNLPGWMLQVITEGFSSDDVNQARDVAAAMMNGADIEDASKGKRGGARILGQVLYDHMNSTGAMKANLDPNELNRLLNYGASGLSAAIGETKFNNLQDYAWQYSHNPSYSGRGRSGSGSKTEKPFTPYNVNPTIIESENEMTADISSRMSNSSFGAYRNGATSSIAVPGQDDGTGMSMQTFRNANEATGYIYHTPGRDRLLDAGIDIAIDPGRKTKKNPVDLNGQMMRVVKMNSIDASDRSALEEYDLPDNSDGVVEVSSDGGETWSISPKKTVTYNKERQEWLNHIDNIKKANPGKKLEDFAMSPDEEESLRKKYNLDPDLNWRDIESALYVLGGGWTTSDAVYADMDTKDELERTRNKIAETYWDNRNSKTGRTTNRFMAHKVGSNTHLDLAATLTTDKDGHLNTDNIIAVKISPENMRNGEITLTLSNGSRIVVSNEYLGGDVSNNLNSKIPGTNLTLGSAIDQVMKPIFDPQAVLTNKGFDADDWRQMIWTLLYDKNNPEQSLRMMNAYGLYDDNAYLKVIDPKEVVRNPERLRLLYMLAVGLLDMKTGVIRDERATHRYQTAQNTSQKPMQFVESGYNTPEEQ